MNFILIIQFSGAFLGTTEMSHLKMKSDKKKYYNYVKHHSFNYYPFHYLSVSKLLQLHIKSHPAPASGS